MALNDAPPFGPVVNGTMVVVFWEYRPSNAAAYIFLALFGLATLGHLIYLLWLRAWIFIPFLLGGICQIFGYLERSVAHSYPTILGPWILQNMLLLVSPPLLAATLYISHGRVATALLHGTTTATPKNNNHRGCCGCCCCACTCTPATTLYILADVVAIFTQLIGTVLPASGTPEAQRLSKIVVLVGLLAQLVALGVFVVLGCGRLHARLRRDPAAAGSAAMVADPGVNWLGYLVVMEVAAGMLIVRSVVRGAEYLEGSAGVVARHEVFVYVFDAVPMLVVMVGFLVLYPARLVREVGRLEARGKREGAEAGGFVELRGV
ncbi:RTA1 like protein-domain-containing protein [Parachaetomium inaequale]|uniref:RTA1 like protein-domain-containing protein n=1 Tax=Parachaetomium inaequale TaxID=2588326 RepID=A0AAN6SW55_9PEZI|nr:RTA1 like protein-domain-containing protein [Parachaetomium inaequale]